MPASRSPATARRQNRGPVGTAICSTARRRRWQCRDKRYWSWSGSISIAVTRPDTEATTASVLPLGIRIAQSPSGRAVDHAGCRWRGQAAGAGRPCWRRTPALVPRIAPQHAAAGCRRFQGIAHAANLGNRGPRGQPHKRHYRRWCAFRARAYVWCWHHGIAGRLRLCAVERAGPDQQAGQRSGECPSAGFVVHLCTIVCPLCCQNN